MTTTTTTTSSTGFSSCRLIHHGAAASSCAHALVWIPPVTIVADSEGDPSSSGCCSVRSSELAYASHSIVNLAHQVRVRIGNDDGDSVWTVQRTLRTCMPAVDASSHNHNHNKRVITCLSYVPLSVPFNNKDTKSRLLGGLACGFSDGSLTIWWKRWRQRRVFQNNNDTLEEIIWTEQPIFRVSTSIFASSVTDVTGYVMMNDGNGTTRPRVLLVTCSSHGVEFHTVNVLEEVTTSEQNDEEAEEEMTSSSAQCVDPPTTTTTTRLASFATNTVRLIRLSSKHCNEWVLLVGTAAPRHNKIHVYVLQLWDNSDSYPSHHHVGSLAGHEDWITSFAWDPMSNSMTSSSSVSSALMASGSQDAKIRLWQFTTTTAAERESSAADSAFSINSMDYDASNDNGNDDVEDEDEGEARLEWTHRNGTTRVTLEALLLGHEEAVTSVQWHPNAMNTYHEESILISSSMDRTILIWGPVGEGGVWAPLTRVGGAGGILGGSVGSSLAGFVDAAVDPVAGDALVGHAHGGAIYFWSLERQQADGLDAAEPSMEDVALRNHWRARPGITGHFAPVVDLCWEANKGEYLLTVSSDQTCRLWAPLRRDDAHEEEVWVELARPQVHGYDLTTITSISTQQHPHLVVSGADEKELRVFDAPLSTTRMLQTICIEGEPESGSDAERVERAFIPSLGLSNKASASDRAEEAEALADGTVPELQNEMSTKRTRLPLERDLGCLSIWPEVRKLFGHDTELFCLTSTVTAQSGRSYASTPFASEVLIASSAKARDVDNASIRLWDVEKGKCIQVLLGGHRSTVATLSFSPDGQYLASSGKDRRFCLWRRNYDSEGSSPSFSLASAIDSAHKRIIWSIHCCPHNAEIFASGSRDGCIKIWRARKPAEESDSHLREMYSFEPSYRIGKKAESVNSLAFAPIEVLSGLAVLAIGLECGMVELWAVPLEANGISDCHILHRIVELDSHIATVTKLAWRPIRRDENTLVLASASADHGCRLFYLRF